MPLMRRARKSARRRALPCLRGGPDRRACRAGVFAVTGVGPHTGQHKRPCSGCHAFHRRNLIMHRALHAPEGLTQRKFAAGMEKADALLFWVDVKALGMIVVGKTRAGAKLYALPSVEVSATAPSADLLP